MTVSATHKAALLMVLQDGLDLLSSVDPTAENILRIVTDVLSVFDSAMKQTSSQANLLDLKVADAEADTLESAKFGPPTPSPVSKDIKP